MEFEHRPTIVLADDDLLIRQMITKACPYFTILEVINGLETLNLAGTSREQRNTTASGSMTIEHRGKSCRSTY